MQRYVHPNAAGLSTDPPVVLVRPHPIHWALPVVTGALYVVSLVLPWAGSSDRIAAPAVAGVVLGACLGLPTTRWEAQGPLLVGFGALVEHSLAASQVASVREQRGVEIVRTDGTTVSLGALLYRYQLMPGGRAAVRVGRQAAAVRRWAAEHRDIELPPGSRLVTVDPRWRIWGGMFLLAAAGPSVSLTLGLLQ